MKLKSFKLITAFLIILVVSCNEPETVVTNYVHPDGSVLRSIVMRSANANGSERFALSDLQVPFDSTWTVKDSVEVNAKGDSTWIRRAEKLFKNAEEISMSYKNDKGKNKGSSRYAVFKKSFRWFNTEYRFSEIIDKKLTFGYPLKDYLNPDELLYFYSPENLRKAKEQGPDSLKLRAFNETINKKTDYWSSKNVVSEWIGEFSKLTEGKQGSDISFKSLKAREDELVKFVMDNDSKFDSLWKAGVILPRFIGESNAAIFRTEADTALERVVRNYFIDFRDYSVRIVMPGKIIGTNGFIDSSSVLLWPVKSDFFLTQPYEMYAESKIPNIWAWVVSGLFLVFVVAGVIVRNKKRLN
jgi:hypothetical protein